VEEALNLVKTKSVKLIADIGTGSGAIAVSLAVNLFAPLSRDMDTSTHISILASDISPQALEVARLNAQKHLVENRITFLQGDLLEPLPKTIDIIIANLPYVGSEEVNNMPSAQYEPRSALDGGEYGLDQIYRLADQIKGKLNPGGFVLLEIGMGQTGAVREYLGRILPDVKIDVIPDLAGIERVVKFTLG
jgi:release factor glutamine methyltransferase